MKKLVTYFKGKREVQLAYLFGSKAQGTDRPASDTDVAVLLEEGFSQKSSLDYKLGLLMELKDILGTENIDLVILNTADPLLKFQVVKYGKLLYQSQGAGEESFRARSFMEYMDIRPMLDFFTKDATRKIRGA